MLTMKAVVQALIYIQGECLFPDRLSTSLSVSSRVPERECKQSQNNLDFPKGDYFVS